MSVGRTFCISAGGRGKSTLHETSLPSTGHRRADSSVGKERPNETSLKKNLETEESAPDSSLAVSKACLRMPFCYLAAPRRQAHNPPLQTIIGAPYGIRPAPWYGHVFHADQSFFVSR